MTEPPLARLDWTDHTPLRVKLRQWIDQQPEKRLHLRNKTVGPVSWHGLDLHGSWIYGSRFTTGTYRRDSVTPEETAEDSPRIAGLIGTGNFFAGPRLTGVCLDNADIQDCVFEYVDFSGASFRGAFFASCLFHKCLFRSADLEHCTITAASFSACDFTDARGLGNLKQAPRWTTYHPPCIDVETLLLSRFTISREFLEYCNVPSTFAEYLPSLIQSVSPLRLESCMLSHSSSDEALCETIFRELQDQEVRVFFSPHHMKPGFFVREQLEQAVNVCDRLILVLSEASMASQWVKNEIAWAFKKQARTKKRVLFPISLVPFPQIRKWQCWDDDLGVDLAAEVRRFHVPVIGQPNGSHGAIRKLVAELLPALSHASPIMLPQ